VVFDFTKISVHQKYNQMKKLIFCLAALACSIASSFSQNQMKTNCQAAPVAPDGWVETNDWLGAFQSVFGKQADTQWVSWLAKQGRFYLNPSTGGLCIVLPDYMYSYAKLRAKFDYGISENGNTRLMPVGSETTRRGGNWYARFIGTLEGVPATLDMVVSRQDGKYLTVMGFFPGNELSNEFSTKFQRDASRLLNAAEWVSR
jgi:hypothetical protein